MLTIIERLNDEARLYLLNKQREQFLHQVHGLDSGIRRLGPVVEIGPQVCLN